MSAVRSSGSGCLVHSACRVERRLVKPIRSRRGQANSFVMLAGAGLVLVLVLAGALYQLGRPRPADSAAVPTSSGSEADDAHSRRDSSPAPLVMYCAAGVRAPVQQIAEQYEREYGVAIQLQYGGSNTLLSQIKVADLGDLYLAADESYTRLAQQQGLVKEILPIASMRPVIAVPRGNPKKITGVRDLLRDDVRSAIGNPDQAAIGQATRQALTAAGVWDAVRRHVTETGVFKPTVPELASDVALGSIDAAIVWDITVHMFPELQAVGTPELDAETSEVTIGVLTSCRTPTEALRFARYLTARDKGLSAFQEHGYQTVDGDRWAEVPELTFFCGSVNRRAVESVIRDFEQREGVVVNTVYNGCGILTAQMRTIRDQQSAGFPDVYLACDRYYLDTVKDWFQEDTDISDTQIVIAVPKGNPQGIQSIKDLARPGLRISVGQPQQCTIGVLTRQLLESEGILEEVMKNVVTETASSAMLLPTVTTRSVDATLAYATDTRAERDKIDIIQIDSPAATAVQPFAIARSSDHKHLNRRLFQAILEARDQFESAGFHVRASASTASPTEASHQ